MHALLVTAIAASGVILAGSTAAVAGATTLFRRVIPRQDGVRVDLNEMADMEKWEEYKKIIHPNKEWLMQRNREHVTIQARDGLTLHGDYFPADTPTDKLLIGFHGYTSCALSDCASIASFFLKQGYDCLLVDHRAHGNSEGKYIGFGVLDRYDCLSWVEYVNQRFACKKQIILYGVSMGGATVLMAMGLPTFPDTVKAVIADCAFTSPYDVFSHILKRDYKLPAFPVMNINNTLCRKKAGYGFQDCSTLTAVKKAKCPVLFIHGKEDNFVPTWMSEANYQACTAPKSLLLVEHAGHGASYYENSSLYEKTVTDFIHQYVFQ